MGQNEKGGALVYVLLLILVFSVLGMALMGNTVSETKRAEMTESDMQAQHLALNGLTYFETAFKAYIQKTDSINIPSFLEQYQDWVPVGPESNPKEMQIKAKLHLVDENNIEVWSKGTVGNVEKTFRGYYMLEYGMDAKPGSPIYKIPVFDGAMAKDFSESGVVGLNLANILNLDLIKGTGDDKKFYRVPEDKLLGLNVANLLGINLANGFNVMEAGPIIATRKGILLGLDILGNKDESLISINVLKLKENEDTNVVINGHYKQGITVLGIPLEIDAYKDINFNKFAIIGNCLIQQHQGDNGFRSFSFQEGLYVNKSLVIGGNEGTNNRSQLMLRGDMLIMENLMITGVDLLFDNSVQNEQSLSMYVEGDAKISNACISPKYDKNGNHNLGLFVKGKLSIENNSGCNTYSGLYYAKGGIEIKTNGKPMIIKGGLIGDVKVDNPNMLKIIEEYPLLPEVKITDVNIIPQGRVIDYEKKGS